MHPILYYFAIYESSLSYPWVPLLPFIKDYLESPIYPSSFSVRQHATSTPLRLQLPGKNSYSHHERVSKHIYSKEFVSKVRVRQPVDYISGVSNVYRR